MIVCWLIYTYKNQLSVFMTKRFIGDSYKEIEDDMKIWVSERKDIEIIDVAESIYNEDDEEYN